MRVLISLTLEEASELVNNKQLSNVKNIGHSKEVTSSLEKYKEENIGCSGSVVYGISRISGNPVNLAKDFSKLPAYLPFRSGRFILEIDKPDDECICIPLENLRDTETLIRKSESDKLKELYVNKLEPKFNLGSSKENLNESCVVFGVQYKDCKYLKYISDTWEEGDKKLGNIPEANVNHMEVFS